MYPHRKAVLAAAFVVALAIPSFAGEKGKPPKLTEQDRQTIIRNFQAELCFSHTYFPMGKVGLRITPEGQVTPGPGEVRAMVEQYGPAAKPGERVKITNVIFKGKNIIFEINGGPVKKKKWYERLSVGGMGGDVTPMDKSGDPTNLDVNNRGSYIALQFKDYVPQLTTDQIKAILKPILDFNSMNAAQAYAESLPPIVQQAIKDHKALVGMDRDMVMAAMGRADKKIRDNDGKEDYEEWMYGQPPKEVNFVRFVGDHVIRVETMKVDGEKIVRTQKEIDLGAGHDTRVAKKETEESEQPADAPSLLRPGEKTVTATPGARQDPRQTPPPGGQTGPRTGEPGQPDNMPASDPTGAPPNIPGGMPGSPQGMPPQ
jgi:hypothetical protein